MVILWADHVDKEKLTSVGKKGVQLGEITRIGVPVPKAFIIPTHLFDNFLVKTGLRALIQEILQKADLSNINVLEEVSTAIQQDIQRAEIDEQVKELIVEYYHSMKVETDHAHALLQHDEPYVSVRTSIYAKDNPEVHFAGQQETFLNVRGTDRVLSAVKACWASLFSPRSIMYRERNNILHEQITGAVIVQLMIDAELSGVLFTSNAFTNDHEETIIEAIYGYGEPIFSGSINPDVYVYDKVKKEVIEYKVEEQEWGLFRTEAGKMIKKPVLEVDKKKRILNDKQVEELAWLAHKIERHYGSVRSAEWVMKSSRFYVLQTRPVKMLRSDV